MVKKIADVFSFDEMVVEHRRMLQSLLKKDGQFDNKDATEINNAFGKQINNVRARIEAFKLVKQQPKRAELFLPEKTSQ